MTENDHPNEIHSPGTVTRHFQKKHHSIAKDIRCGEIQHSEGQDIPQVCEMAEKYAFQPYNADIEVQHDCNIANSGRLY